jgi:hypothetical protein
MGDVKLSLTLLESDGMFIDFCNEIVVFAATIIQYLTNREIVEIYRDRRLLTASSSGVRLLRVINSSTYILA